jgi:uncharacterized protein GlcG (DUF336 family)
LSIPPIFLEIPMQLTLGVAQSIVRDALAHARKAGFKPVSVVVLDARCAVMAAASEDGTSLKRFEIARGKASGALAFNVGSRKLGEMAVERPHFFAGAAQAVGGLVPVAGGVLIRDANAAVIGAVGISGDTSDNDETAAIAGIVAAGLTADGG